MKGFAAFHDTMVRADDVLERLEKKPWSGPAAVMLAEHDGLVETEDLLARFDRAFPNPRTRIFWYGEERFARGLSAHVCILPEAVPEKRIASFSHMSMTYRPDNPMYGESGAERLCWNGQSKAESKACEEGAEIWYSGERHQPGDGAQLREAHLQSLVRRAARGHSRRDGPMKAPHTSACKFF